MTHLLLRLFVRDHRNSEDPKVRAAIGSLSGMVGIVCNLLLCLGKLTAGALADSVSIMADAMNNLSDACGSVVTLLGFRLAEKPADKDHPYGHARYEYLSGLAVSAMILVIGFELGISSIKKILDPQPVEFTLVTGVILLLSIVLKLWLSRFNRKLGSRIGSTALKAAAQDSRNDCAATAAVLAAGLVERFSGFRVDGYVGLAVAAFILYSGIDMAKQTISPLLGEAASPELRERIVDYISSQPKVLGYHDLMVHDYGPGQRFASLHVEMDHNENVMACHALIDDMERECLRSHNIHLVIHYDPVITDDPELNRLKERTARLLGSRDRRLSLHDFRMKPGIGHTDLIFDVSLPEELRGQENAIREELEAGLNQGSDVIYEAVITFDAEGFNRI